MLYCSYCAKNVEPAILDGSICCSECGKVIILNSFTDEPTFLKDSAGLSQLSGNFVKTVQSEDSVSRGRILRDAQIDMASMAYAMEVDGGDSVLMPASKFYRIAVERNFTRGRRKEQVEAACLYISCRYNKKPFLLIDFSEHLRINVYVLGAVFLQLCKLLSLEEHSIVQKPVDPSLFIHRFSERLLGGRNAKVERTALRIIASMKRDWMQTGRKPSGLCGAALYVSALSHGLKCSKSDVVKVVHICEATLAKRLIEFENTQSGSLTIEEFNKKAEEFEREERSIKQPNIGLEAVGTSELLCGHKSGELPFAHGLCKNCYYDFIKISGGLEGGSEPPAFQRAERERTMRKEDFSQNADDSSFVTSACQNNSKHLNFEKEANIPNVSRNENSQQTDNAKLHGVDDTSPKVCDESESFSDIDDVEVDEYLHNEEEKQYKKIIWEEMNKEYLEEQAAKEAAAAAAKEACEANFHNCPEGMQAAQELAAAAAAAVAKSRKERQQKRAAEASNSSPPQTAAEATRQMLTKKRLMSKVNYDVLEKLFDESATPENAKKIRTKSDSYNDGDVPHSSKEDTESKGPYEDSGVTGAAYIDDMYMDNIEGYDYDDGYDFDDY